MPQATEMVRRFFEDYQRGTATADPGLVAAQYGDEFLFAGPQGAQAIRKEDFLRGLPQRAAFLKHIGLASSTIQALEATRLDDHYVLAKVHWRLRFEREAAQPLLEDISTTYLLYRQADSLRIVFQLDHQDLMARVQDLGL